MKTKIEADAKSTNEALKLAQESLVQKEQEINELKRMNRELKERDTLLQKISVHIPGVIYQYQLTPDGRSFFPYVSETIKKVHGFTPEEIREDAGVIFERIHPEDLDSVVKSIQESYQFLTRWEYDYRINLPNIGERWHKGVASPEKLSDGSVLWHGYMIDITEMKEIENRLRIERDRAKESDRIKSQFLANMSHELRTPLNGIMGMIQLLELTNLDEEQQEYVEITMKSSVALTEIINEILNYTSLEKEKDNRQEVAFRPEELLKEVVELHRVGAVKKKIDIDYELSPEVPAVVVGDRYKLRQILNNLTGNAVKFTDSGSVQLKVGARDADEDRNVIVEFKVEDTGCGIPSEKIGNIFNSFYQTDDTDTRKYGGLGLGLTIANELTRILGGDIQIESQSGQGSCFTVTLEMQREVEQDSN
jgi:signal transduction histidine kinase